MQMTKRVRTFIKNGVTDTCTPTRLKVFLPQTKHGMLILRAQYGHAELQANAEENKNAVQTSRISPKSETNFNHVQLMSTASFSIKSLEFNLSSPPTVC